MSAQPTSKTTREKITLAAITGMIAGLTRAIAGKVLDHLASG